MKLSVNKVFSFKNSKNTDKITFLVIEMKIE